MNKRTSVRFIFCLMLLMVAAYNVTTYVTLFQTIPQVICLFGAVVSGLWAASIAYDLILGEF